MAAKTLVDELADHVRWLRLERGKQLELSRLTRERADWLDEEACNVERMIDEEKARAGGQGNG